MCFAALLFVTYESQFLWFDKPLLPYIYVWLFCNGMLSRKEHKEVKCTLPLHLISNHHHTNRFSAYHHRWLKNQTPIFLCLYKYIKIILYELVTLFLLFISLIWYKNMYLRYLVLLSFTVVTHRHTYLPCNKPETGSQLVS